MSEVDSSYRFYTEEYEGFEREIVITVFDDGEIALRGSFPNMIIQQRQLLKLHRMIGDALVKSKELRFEHEKEVADGGDN